jgi:hypothetical protein
MAATGVLNIATADPQHHVKDKPHTPNMGSLSLI